MTNPHGPWRSVEIACEPGFEDMASACVFESGFSGSMERIADDRTIITAYYQPHSGAASPVTTFRTLIAGMIPGSSLLPVRILCEADVPDEDWEVKWRDGLGVIEAGDRLAVRPSWVTYGNPSGRIEIIIDPRMAFGTGGHATTRLCLEAMERLDVAGRRVLDAGCGSGVLSIAAAKLGAAYCYGFDIDEDSVNNARDNATINGVTGRVTFEQGDLGKVAPGRFDVVFANMISSILIANLSRFHTFLAPEAVIIFSGLLAEEETMFSEALAANGFAAGRVDHDEEWITVEARENPHP